MHHEAWHRSRSLSRKVTKHDVPFLRPGIGVVSLYALDKLLEQLNQVSGISDDEQCSGRFTATFGLPCKHLIAGSLRAGQTLNIIQKAPTLTAAKRQRLLDQVNEIINGSVRQYIVDPAAAAARGRPTAAQKRRLPSNSTRRDPCRFEIVDAQEQQRKCGRCHQYGHNRRTCTADVN
ncbi:hypothetical protein DFJ73DRAFT_840404 [Zopfochytrium polystomum]|nr:hypothetical protein DFJ73DRAFT_840404 [Zopfochytrium polystomum]